MYCSYLRILAGSPKVRRAAAVWDCHATEPGVAKVTMKSASDTAGLYQLLAKPHPPDGLVKVVPLRPTSRRSTCPALSRVTLLAIA